MLAATSESGFLNPEEQATQEAAGWSLGRREPHADPFRPESHLNPSQKLAGALHPPRRCGLGGVLLAVPPGTIRAVGHLAARFLAPRAKAPAVLTQTLELSAGDGSYLFIFCIKKKGKKTPLGCV